MVAVVFRLVQVTKITHVILFLFLRTFFRSDFFYTDLHQKTIGLQINNVMMNYLHVFLNIILKSFTIERIRMYYYILRLAMHCDMYLDSKNLNIQQTTHFLKCKVIAAFTKCQRDCAKNLFQVGVSFSWSVNEGRANISQGEQTYHKPFINQTFCSKQYMHKKS